MTNFELPPALQMAQRITAVFEEGKTKLPLDKLPLEKFVEDLGDGRGYTCNIPIKAPFGFTTADEEVVMCIEKYTEIVGHNNLTDCLPVLRKLRDNGSDDTSELDRLGFPQHWRDACSNPHFETAYAFVANELFGKPALAQCKKLGLSSAVALAVIFDTLVQHGNEEGDHDGFSAILARTLSMIGHPRVLNETAFLKAFLLQRRTVLGRADNKETREEWERSVPRVDALLRLVTTNPTLQTPVHVLCRDFDVHIA